MIAFLCSRNPNKARELERLLPGWRVIPLEADGYPEETGSTYYENARGKALFGRSVGDPEAWMIGEDSGIEVDGLGGAPGLESARLGGDDPVGWLLAALEGAGGKVRSIEFEEEAGKRQLALEVDFPAGARETAVAKLSDVEHVTGARWSR